jgi:septum formation protein
MIVLASKSPRRAELLAAGGFEFSIRVADIDESPLPGEDPRDHVIRLAAGKAAAVPAHGGETVLAADTIVVLDGEIMGKPRDGADAVRMLSALSGRPHEVTTGVCIRRGDDSRAAACTTAVWFAELSPAEIEWYVASGEPMDKAGAYGIQGLASRFVTRIEGSYSNVVGLPVEWVHRTLRDWA